ncbi:WD repeat-containing protein, putative [Plasmodium chabaudi adami]|uniref:WD repeat-containing protein, putative n=1 Tax=Plasmodium chabaudi adami TaxID=5826 RepID=A0A1D3LIY6_PLACE|nr:WD repeat-containing protein, putative [Plasmodium chabaudi adami]
MKNNMNIPNNINNNMNNNYNNENYNNVNNNSRSIINNNLNMPAGINNMANNMNDRPNNMKNFPNGVNGLNNNIGNINNLNKMHNPIGKIHGHINNMGAMNNNIKHGVQNIINGMPSGINNMHSNLSNIPDNIKNMANAMNPIPNNINDIRVNANYPMNNMNTNVNSNNNVNIPNDMKHRIRVNSSEITNNVNFKNMMNNNNSAHYGAPDNSNRNMFYVNDMKNVDNNVINIHNKRNSTAKEKQNNIPQFREKEYLENVGHRDKYLLNKNETDKIYLQNKQLNNMNQGNIQNLNNSNTRKSSTGSINRMINNSVQNTININSNNNINPVTNIGNNNDTNNNILQRNMKNIENGGMHNPLNMNQMNPMNLNKNFNFSSNDPHNFNINGVADNKMNNKFKDPNYNNINKNINVPFNEESKYDPYNLGNNINRNNGNNGIMVEKSMNNADHSFSKQHNGGMFDVKAHKGKENFGGIKNMNNANKVGQDIINLSTTNMQKLNEKNQKANGNNNNFMGNNVPKNMENADLYKLQMNYDKLNPNDPNNYNDFIKENSKGKYISGNKYNTNANTIGGDPSKNKIQKMENELINKKFNTINNNNENGSNGHMNENMIYEEIKKMNNASFEKMVGNDMLMFNGHRSMENGINQMVNMQGFRDMKNILSINNYRMANDNDPRSNEKNNNMFNNQIPSFEGYNGTENLKGTGNEFEEKKRKKKREKKNEMEKNEKNGLNRDKNLDDKNTINQLMEYNGFMHTLNENNESGEIGQNIKNNSFDDISKNYIQGQSIGNDEKELNIDSNLNESMKKENYEYIRKQNMFENYENMNNLKNAFLEGDQNMLNNNDIFNKINFKFQKKKSDDSYENANMFPNGQNDEDKKLMVLSRLFGNVMGENANNNNNDDNTQTQNENNMNNNGKLSNIRKMNSNTLELELYKNMPLDTMLNKLNLDKNILNILKDKINNINRNINVNICSTPMETPEEPIKMENIDLLKLINLFDEFLNWSENNLYQIKSQLYNIAFCLLLELYILILANRFSMLIDFKNKYLKNFEAYHPVIKFLSNCVSLNQIFEISLLRFKEKNAKHIAYMNKLGKASLMHYLSVYGSIPLYNLIMTKIKIIEIDDANKNFNFFHEFISMNFLYNGNLNYPVQWNLPSIYFIKDVSETQNDDNIKSTKDKEENCYVPNENSDAYYYYKYIIKMQADNRLKVTKNRMPSMLYYCLNNCTDMTCAEISSFDGSLVATAHSNNIIKLWNIKKSQMNKIKEKQKDMEIDNNENVDEIKNYSNIEENKPDSIYLDDQDENGIAKLYGNMHNVSSLSFGETNKILLSGNLNGDIYLYSTISNRNYVKYSGGHTPIWSIDTAFLGYFFCTSEDDGNLRIYSTNKTYPLVTYKYNCTSNICKYHYNNTIVASGYYDNYVHLYDIRMNSFIKRFKNNYPSSHGVTSLSFSKNGRLLSFGGGYTNNINVIDLVADKFIDVEPKQFINTKGYSLGDYYSSAKSEENHLGFYPLPNESEKLLMHKNIDEYEDKILSIDFSYDNNLLVSMSCDSHIDFYNCSKASKELKNPLAEKKRIKSGKDNKNNSPYVRLSKSYGVNYSNLISAKFTPENVLLLFGINTLI